MRTASTRIRTTRATCRWSRVFAASAGCRPTTTGFFRFTTIKPGRVPGPSGSLQAPHIAVTVFARGLLKHLVTRIYFPDEPANAEDPVLALVPAERRATLIARKSADAAAQGGSVLEWDIVLQAGSARADETVFFDI